jgi:hypothetical protein
MESLIKEVFMKGYWWQCESCGANSDFGEACDCKGIAHFIWDVLLPSSWDQSKLLLKCKKCNKQSLRITYKFPRKDEVVLKVIHIVGLDPNNGYIPMIWETYPEGDENERWFDFKYINGRNIYGLNKPAVFSRDDLKQLFTLYREKTNLTEFP